jgi:hypothetical protein
MAKAAIKSRRPTDGSTTTNIRNIDLERLDAASTTNRITKIDMITVLLDAWETFTPEQQAQIIRRDSSALVGTG